MRCRVSSLATVSRSLPAVAGWLATSLFNMAAAADQRPTIRWLVSHEPPATIVHGEGRGGGFGDNYRKALIERLPEFAHRVEITTSRRREALMRRGEPVCSILMIRTPAREQFALFASKPYLLALPVRLVMQEETAESLRPLAHDDTLRLEDVLGDGTHHLGIFKSVSFDSLIDRQLADIGKGYPDAIRYFDEAPGSTLRNLVRLMSKGRFDVTLGHSVVVHHWTRNDPSIGRLVYIPVASVVAPIPLHVSCTKSLFGQEVIRQVEQLPGLDSLADTAARDYASRLPEEEQVRYRAILQAARRSTKAGSE